MGFNARPIWAYSILCECGGSMLKTPRKILGSFLGNHRSFILDFTSASLIGENFPNVMPARSRKLHCEPERLINNYTKVLDQLCDRNNMYRQITSLYKNADSLSNADFPLLIKKWDNELTDHMKCAENISHGVRRWASGCNAGGSLQEYFNS